MQTVESVPRGQPGRTRLTPALTRLLTFAAGANVVNLFASQPVIAEIAGSLGMPARSAGLVSTLTLLGDAAGLVFALPLVDRLENRRLITGTLAASVAALAAAALAPGTGTLLGAVFLVGLTSSTVQMMVALAAALSDEAERGRVVGGLMRGLFLGILLSRPFGALVAGALGWRAMYGAAAVVSAVIAVVLSMRLPAHHPGGRTPYLRALASLWPLLTREPVLRRRAAYSALLMCGFSAFWTAVAWRLAEPPFELGARGIALFALAGAGGAAVAAPAGRAGDRGLTRQATLWAHLAVVAGILLAAVAAAPSAIASRWASLVLLVASALLLDVGSVADQALGRRAVNMVRPEARGRLNGLFTGAFFVGGACGAALAGPAWAAGGWLGVCGLALGPALAALALRVTEPWPEAGHEVPLASPTLAREGSPRPSA